MKYSKAACISHVILKFKHSTELLEKQILTYNESRLNTQAKGILMSIKRSVLFSVHFTLISHFMLVINKNLDMQAFVIVHEYKISGLL